MWSWTINAEEATSQAPEKIWEKWAEVSRWPEWDIGISWASLDGPFQEGTKGRLQPKGGPVVKFQLTRVEKHREFTDIGKMPFTKLIFHHTIVPQPDGENIVIHQAEVRGLLAPLLKNTLGKKLREDLPKALKKLVHG